MEINLEKATRVEAMLVRAEAAHRLLRDRELDGLDALRLILLPGADALAASMAVAQETGPSLRAKELAARSYAMQERSRSRTRDVTPPARAPRPRKPRRAARPLSESLDETLLRL